MKDIKNPLAQEAHKEVHGFAPIHRYLKEICQMADQITDLTYGSRRLEIKRLSKAASAALDEMAEEMVKFIREQGDK